MSNTAHTSTTKASPSVEKHVRTDGSIIKDNQEASIVNPLDLEAAADALPLGECGLDVPGLELLGEAGEGENASDAGGELGESGCHRSTRLRCDWGREADRGGRG